MVGEDGAATTTSSMSTTNNLNATNVGHTGIIKTSKRSSRVEAELKCEEDKGGGGISDGGGGGPDGKAKSEANRKSSQHHHRDATIVTNSFFNEFSDCMHNLPNRLQVLFTELSTIDAQVKSKKKNPINLPHPLISLYLIMIRIFRAASNTTINQT